MGWDFNHSIQLNQKLKHLTMSFSFNQPIRLTNEIKYLCLSLISYPHNLIDNLPNGVKELEFGVTFNSPMNNLPTSIKIIKLDCCVYEHDLNCLPIIVETF